MDREYSKEELQSRIFDLVIVGGGIFGCCAAWDAALRGLDVALVEMDDFSHATSANHLKMVHGGIRYMQHLDIPRVRESVRERSALLRIAPHLIEPLPVVMPTYGHGVKGKEFLRAGMLLYDLITMDKNRGIADSTRKIPWARTLSKRETLEILPGLNQSGLTGAGIFHDGQMYSPQRLALAFVDSAISKGAAVVNHTRAERVVTKNGKVEEIEVTDTLSGERYRVCAKAVLNTVGPWTAKLLEKSSQGNINLQPLFSRDVAFLIRRKLIDGYAFACQTTNQDKDAVISRGGRHLFIAPWRDYTIIGVWHGVHHGGPDDFKISDKDIENFVEEVNSAYPDFDISPDEVSMINAGLILFSDDQDESKGISFGKRSILIDHGKSNGVAGLVTLIGVRATTARGMAEKAIDLVTRILNKKAKPCETEHTPISGGYIEDFKKFVSRALFHESANVDREVLVSLIRNHGSNYTKVLALTEEEPKLLETLGQSNVLGAEVVFAIRKEMARTLADVVFRRTDLGTAGSPGVKALRSCADLMASELGWDEGKIQSEISKISARFPFMGNDSLHFTS